jgi:hypothetical protein
MPATNEVTSPQDTIRMRKQTLSPKGKSSWQPTPIKTMTEPLLGIFQQKIIFPESPRIAT